MILLITGCINVDKEMIYTTIKDQNKRLADYIETIKWAIEETSFDKILFCENSNYAFDKNKYERLAMENKKEFEYLTFKGDNVNTKTKGKGYGEGEIVLYALKNSKLMKNEKSFCKITGRLRISNVNKLIKSTSKNYFMNKRLLNEVDTRFYFIQKSTFLETLKESYKCVNDNENFYLEHAYYDSLICNNVKYRTFYERPLFIGFSGSTGKEYKDKKNKNEFITTVLFKTNIYNCKSYWKLRRKIKKIIKK